MSLSMPLAPGELLARTGMPTDVLTFWTRKGLVLPIDATRVAGQHRRFAYYEANLAAIMLQLREFGANIDTMQGVAGIYRNAIAWGTAAGLTFDDVIAVTRFMDGPVAEQAARIRATGELDGAAYGASVDALREGIKSRFQLTDKVLDFALHMDVAEYHKHHTAYAEIMSQPSGVGVPYPTYFWRTAEGWKRGNHQGGQLRASIDGVFATIAIDVVGILYRVWNKP